MTVLRAANCLGGSWPLRGEAPSAVVSDLQNPALRPCVFAMTYSRNAPHVVLHGIGAAHVEEGMEDVLVVIERLRTNAAVREHPTPELH